MTAEERRWASAAATRLLRRGGPLRREAGRLWVEGIPGHDIAKHAGTPVLVYSAARLRDNLKTATAAATASPHPARIHFALKACYLVGVAALAKEAGVHVEIMSEYEYLLARRIGFSPDQMVLNSPAKRASLLERAVVDGVRLINVESLAEIAALDSLGSAHGVQIDVGVRINPVSRPGLRGPFTPPGSKFGFDVAGGQAAYAIRRVVGARFLSLRAVHCHGYTRQYRPDVHRVHVAALVAFVRETEAKLGIHIPVLDLGGGFGSRVLMEARGHPLHAFIRAIARPVSRLRGEREIIIEPGRYLVNDAAICLTSVLTWKRNGPRRWVLVDAGRNILPPRENAEYVVVPCEARPGRIRHHVGDFLCMPSEPDPLWFVSAAVAPGDVLAVLNAGAYTFSMAQSFGDLIPSAILVDGAEWTWLHRRPSAEGQLRNLSGAPSSGD